MQYITLVESPPSPRDSVNTLDLITSTTDNERDSSAFVCTSCKMKLNKKQKAGHSPIKCLTQRCELLEDEIYRLKDHDIKSRLVIKELENRISTLEDAIEGLTKPKKEQAAPFNFAVAHKNRQKITKSHSEDVSSVKTNVNFDNIIQTRKSSVREHIGLFGSLGASSQIR